MHEQLDIFDGPNAEVVAPVRLDLIDADIVYRRHWLEIAQRRAVFDALLNTTPWSQDEIVIFDKRVKVPRLSSWHGDAGSAYSYSNIALEPRSWTPTLEMLRGRVELTAGCSFNSVLANLYRDGADSVAWHTDDEAELGIDPVIASVSLGATRVFQLRHRTTPAHRHAMELHDGSLLVMRGTTQRCWHHQIPKTAKIVGPRINLTFRTVG